MQDHCGIRAAAWAAPGGRSTKSLEVALDSPSRQLFCVATRRLRRLRWVANAGTIAFALLIVTALIARLARGPGAGLASPLWIAVFAPGFLLISAGAIINLFVFSGFFRVRCPNCDARWSSRFPMWVDARCHTCGYNCGRDDGDF